MKAKIYIWILLVALISSCGDDIPTDYKPENVVEAILIVGEPIQNINILRTQPLYHNYNYYKSFIKDAEVVISGEGQQFKLEFNFDTLNPGYFYPDKNYLVKPGVEYKIEIKLSSGELITGETKTPQQTEWTISPKNFIQYPIDSLKLPPSDTISWRKPAGYDFSMIAVVCLDTLEYGKYLAVPTTEKNRRIYKPYASERQYKDISSTSMIPARNDTSFQVPVVWSAFKWFGKHEVVIYVPDWNYTRWFLQNVGSNTTNPLLSSIEGAIGVFGSASVIRDTAVLLKNQP